MKKQKFGAVDMHNANVFFDGNKLTIIDRSFMENFFANYKDEKIRAVVMKDILRLLSGNEKALFLGAMCKTRWLNAEVLHLKHKKTSTAVMKKFINITNGVLKPVFQNDMDYANSRDFIRCVSPSNREERKMINLLERSF